MNSDTHLGQSEKLTWEVISAFAKVSEALAAPQAYNPSFYELRGTLETIASRTKKIAEYSLQYRSASKRLMYLENDIAYLMQLISNQELLAHVSLKDLPAYHDLLRMKDEARAAIKEKGFGGNSDEQELGKLYYLHHRLMLIEHPDPCFLAEEVTKAAENYSEFKDDINAQLAMYRKVWRVTSGVLQRGDYPTEQAHMLAALVVEMGGYVHSIERFKEDHRHNNQPVSGKRNILDRISSYWTLLKS